MKTMVVDNSVENARVYDKLGVDRVFIDLEINNKVERQGHLDTVISRHSISDIASIKKVLNRSSLLVRINPMFKGSKIEIETAIESGADHIMLPMFTSAKEVADFIHLVGGRVRTVLLLETSQAMTRIEQILNIPGIDEIHIGLNDLHLSLKLRFMFELMASPLLELLASKIVQKDIELGIGGIARLGDGNLPAELILKEHVRLNSNGVILSRTFKGSSDLDEAAFKQAHDKLKDKYNEFKKLTKKELELSKLELVRKVVEIVGDHK